MQVHKQMHEKFSLSSADFARWIQLFTQTVDQLFEGENAALAKQRAISIATVMQLKILHPSSLYQ
jgi:hemoglobin